MNKLTQAVVAVGGSAVLAMTGGGFAAASATASPESPASCTEKTAAQNEVDSAQDTLTDAEQKVGYWEEQVKSANAAKNAAGQSATDAQNDLDHWSTIIRQENKDKNAAQDNVDALQKEIDSDTAALADLQDRLTTIEQTVRYLNADKNTEQAKADDLATQVRAASADKQKNLAALPGLQTALDQANAGQATAQSTLNVATQNAAGAADDITLRQSYIAAFKEKLAVAESQLAAAQSQIDGYTSDITLRNGYIAAFQQKYAAAQATIKSANQQITLQQHLYQVAKAAGNMDAANAAHAAADAARVTRDAATAQLDHYGPASQAQQQGHIDKDNAAIAALQPALSAAQADVRHYGPASRAQQQGHIDKDQALLDAQTAAQEAFDQAQQTASAAQTALDAANTAIANDTALGKQLYPQYQAALAKVAQDKTDGAVAYKQVLSLRNQVSQAKSTLAADEAAQSEWQQKMDDAAAAGKRDYPNVLNAKHALATANDQIATAQKDGAEAYKTLLNWRSEVALWTQILHQAQAKLDEVVCPSGAANAPSTSGNGPTGTDGSQAATSTTSQLGTANTVAYRIAPAATVSSSTGKHAQAAPAQQNGESATYQLAETGLDNPTIPWELTAAGIAILVGTGIVGATTYRRFNGVGK
jgi:chromosome segregation ATPase